MNNDDSATWVAIIILMLVFLLPIGWIVLAYPAEPHSLVKGEPVREAAQAAGIQVVHVTNVTWSLSGAQGGKVYLLEDNAGNTLAVQTQRFASAETRDAAILTFGAQSMGKGRTAGTLFVVGDWVIHIGPDQGGMLKRIGYALKNRQDVQENPG